MRDRRDLDLVIKFSGERPFPKSVCHWTLMTLREKLIHGRPSVYPSPVGSSLSLFILIAIGLASNDLDFVHNLRDAFEMKNGFLGELFLKKGGNLPMQNKHAVIVVARYVSDRCVGGRLQAFSYGLNDVA